jgi:hypothetical protein
LKRDIVEMAINDSEVIKRMLLLVLDQPWLWLIPVLNIAHCIWNQQQNKERYKAIHLLIGNKTPAFSIFIKFCL